MRLDGEETTDSPAVAPNWTANSPASNDRLSRTSLRGVATLCQGSITASSDEGLNSAEALRDRPILASLTKAVRRITDEAITRSLPNMPRPPCAGR
jgi:hypothetical protein